MALVHKQGIPDLDSIPFFDNDLGFHATEIIGDQRILTLDLRLHGFQVRFALQVYVEAFA